MPGSRLTWRVRALRRRSSASLATHLELSDQLVEPALSIDAAGQAVTMNVEVRAESQDEALAIARRLLGEAVIAAGLATEWHTVPDRSVLLG